MCALHTYHVGNGNSGAGADVVVVTVGVIIVIVRDTLSVGVVGRGADIVCGFCLVLESKNVYTAAKLSAFCAFFI